MPATPAPARPKPLIGILPRVEERSKNNGLAVLSQLSIVEGVRAAGGLPVVLAQTTDPFELQEYVDACDGFVIPGGGDIDPQHYGQARLEECGPAEPAPRDEFDLVMARLVVAADKPLLGICRGNQVLNVALGGTLWQDLPSQRGSAPEPAGEDAHEAARLAAAGAIAHSQGRPFELHTHEARVAEGTLLAAIVARADELASAPAFAQADVTTLVNYPADPSRLMVNSLHHQAVRDVAPGLEVCALAPDGTVESVAMPGKRFVLGVQWHPESLWGNDPVALAIFAALVDAARK